MNTNNFQSEAALRPTPPLSRQDLIREWLRRQRTYRFARWLLAWITAKLSRMRSSAMLRTSALPPVIEYQGEFGPELICFLPFAYYLWQKGLIGHHKIKTYKGMSSYYYFIPKEHLIESEESRRFVPANQRPSFLPNRDEWFATRSAYERYPDFREHYKNDIVTFDRPILVVNNKYCLEFGLRPFNYIAPSLLAHIFAEMGDAFQIIYIRQGFSRRQLGFSIDDNETIDFDDHRCVEDSPNVLSFDALMERYDYKYDFNTLKNLVMANTHHYITVQGGGAYNFAQFKGSIISVLHKRGRETDFAYDHGAYTYGSSPSPRLIVSKTDDELIRTLPALRGFQPPSF